MRARISGFWRRAHHEAGQAATEYAVVIVLVGLIAAALATSVPQTLVDKIVNAIGSI